MSGYLVDTDVLSEAQKPKPAATAIGWLRDHEADLYTSAVVIGEIAWGIERLAKGKKRTDLGAWLHGKVIPKMEGRILRFDTRVALEWGVLQAELEATGHRMPWRDSVIASTARRHRLVLATRNAKDYEHAGIDLVNGLSTRCRGLAALRRVSSGTTRPTPRATMASTRSSAPTRAARDGV